MSIRGLSLLETTIGLAMGLLMLTAALSILLSIERAFRDQDLLDEARQNTQFACREVSRAIRDTGQGLPVAAFMADDSIRDESTAFLPGTSATNLRVRTTDPDSILPLPPTHVIPALPLTLSTMGRSQYVPSATVLISGQSTTGPAWVRMMVAGSAGSTVSVHWLSNGDAGTDGLGQLALVSGITAAVENARWYYHSGGSLWVRRSDDLNDPDAVAWGSASELARNVVLFDLEYLDGQSQPVDPRSAASRQRITSVRMRLSTEMREPSSDGRRETAACEETVAVRNPMGPI